MTEGIRSRNLNLNYLMDSALTPADVMLMTKHRGNAAATTGIGLAAGLGGGALLLGIAGLWGLNQASKARAKAAEQVSLSNQNAINNVSALLLSERTSREAWQNVHTPTIRNYVDVQAGAGAGSISAAEALALATNGGINSAIGHDSFLKVQRYSAPTPCGCDSYNG